MTLPILVPLIGLPGVGKTKFVNNVTKLLNEWNSNDLRPIVLHFHYDDFLPQIRSNDDKATKRYRRAALLVVDRILQVLAESSRDLRRSADDVLENLSAYVNSLSAYGDSIAARAVVSASTFLANTSSSPLHANTPFIVFLDDNNNYRSMRYEFYRLSRKYSVSFLQLFFDSPPSVAKTNDASRDASRRVGDDVIDKMATTLETPNPDGYRWERRSCRIIDHGSASSVSPKGIVEKTGRFIAIEFFGESDVWRIIDRIVDESRNPVKMPLIVESVSEEQREKDREISLKNVLHQCDIKLRNLVGQRMKELKSGGEAFDGKREAARLAGIKSTILNRVKSGEIELDLDSELEVLFLDEIFARYV